LYAATDLPAGNFVFKVVGVNSRGEGAASEPATVTVVLAAAA
jgi:hypothetical protein